MLGKITMKIKIITNQTILAIMIDLSTNKVNQVDFDYNREDSNQCQLLIKYRLNETNTDILVKKINIINIISWNSQIIRLTTKRETPKDLKCLIIPKCSQKSMKMIFSRSLRKK
jgi:hypothetical protein